MASFGGVSDERNSIAWVIGAQRVGIPVAGAMSPRPLGQVSMAMSPSVAVSSNAKTLAAGGQRMGPEPQRMVSMPLPAPRMHNEPSGRNGGASPYPPIVVTSSNSVGGASVRFTATPAGPQAANVAETAEALPVPAVTVVTTHSSQGGTACAGSAAARASFSSQRRFHSAERLDSDALPSQPQAHATRVKSSSAIAPAGTKAPSLSVATTAVADESDSLGRSSRRIALTANAGDESDSLGRSSRRITLVATEETAIPAALPGQSGVASSGGRWPLAAPAGTGRQTGNFKPTGTSGANFSPRGCSGNLGSSLVASTSPRGIPEPRGNYAPGIAESRSQQVTSLVSSRSGQLQELRSSPRVPRVPPQISGCTSPPLAARGVTASIPAHGAAAGQQQHRQQKRSAAELPIIANGGLVPSSSATTKASAQHSVAEAISNAAAPMQHPPPWALGQAQVQSSTPPTRGPAEGFPESNESTAPVLERSTFESDERYEFLRRIETLEQQVVDRNHLVERLSDQQARLDRLEVLARENEMLKAQVEVYASQQQHVPQGPPNIGGASATHNRGKAGTIGGLAFRGDNTDSCRRAGRGFNVGSAQRGAAEAAAQTSRQDVKVVTAIDVSAAKEAPVSSSVTASSPKQMAPRRMVSSPALSTTGVKNASVMVNVSSATGPYALKTPRQKSPAQKAELESRLEELEHALGLRKAGQ